MNNDRTGFKQKLNRLYQKERYNPKLIGLFVNPSYIIRKGLYKGIYANKDYLTGRLLDFGCGNKPYKEIFNVREYIGVDIKINGYEQNEKYIDVFYNGHTLPFDDNYFDSAFSSEVFDDIFNLEEILSELKRVLKPGGHILITYPFVWDEHDVPYDFARYTSFGMEHLLKESGFDIVLAKKSTAYLETVFQMINAYIWQCILPRNKKLKTALVPFLITPFTILGIGLSKIFPKNENFYHNNIIVAKKRVLQNEPVA
ncbi:MAG: class I SAM-dependent methyltransferase [Bacteroidales bacterium]|nr:class I SAM-dependent methyltransferase [Bacteroidales bacterium]